MVDLSDIYKCTTYLNNLSKDADTCVIALLVEKLLIILFVHLIKKYMSWLNLCSHLRGAYNFNNLSS